MSHRSRKDNRRNKFRSAPAMATSAECAEERMLLSAAPIDGVGNNQQNSEWGSTAEAFLRLVNAEYADAISAVGGEDRPSARLISNAVSDSGGEDVLSDRLMSAMIYTWGQFIDHDITLTESGTTEGMSIPVPIGDPSFDPFGTGTQTIDTMRSAFDSTTGTDAANPREQVNLITAFLDGSMVYGSDAETAASLRTFADGLMKTSEGELLPVGDGGMFQAGDIRANENPGLTSLQTLFVREHNRQAARIASSHPELSDEQMYQRARSIVAAEIQAITFNEWLPTLLGRNALDRYTGYDPLVNPGISNEFATAAFRFGHSLLGDDLEFFDNDGLSTREEVPLSEAFFNPGLVTENGIDSILKYLTADTAHEVDTEVVDGVRNFLFGPPGAGGLDLASLNIQRGRDHGLADYNSTREAIGLPRVTSFADITSDHELQDKLASLYGTVNDVDLWIGGLAEDHVRRGSVGETFRTIIVDQFERLRDGDRFWYQNQFSGKKLAQLQRTSLSDIIERNTSLTSIQQNSFVFKAGIAGTVRADLNRNRRSGRNEPRVARVQVQLINMEDDSVVATATTNQRGEYRFGVEDGLRTGRYQVKATKSDGTQLATSRRVAITGGDDFERVNLTVPAPPQPRPPGPSPQQSRGNGRPSTGYQASGHSQRTNRNRSIVSENTNTTVSGLVDARVSARSAQRAANSGSLTNAATTTPGSGEVAKPAVFQQSSSAIDLHSIDSLFETLPPGLL